MKVYNNAAENIGLPDGILFDTDNTLYPYSYPNKMAMAAVKDKVKQLFSIDQTDFEAAFRAARLKVKQRLEGTAASHSRLLYMQCMLESLGLGSQIIWALDLEQTYWRTFLSNAALFDGVVDVLEEIRILGIPVAVVTDLTAQIQFRKIVYFNLDQYFDFIITSEEAGKDKPAKEPFEIALEKMNLNVSHKIWMVGDNSVNDIIGAKESIGAITFQKIHDGARVNANDSEPDFAFGRYHDLLNFIKHQKAVNATSP